MILHDTKNKIKNNSVEYNARGESTTGKKIAHNRTTKQQQMISERVSDHMKENITADYILLDVTDEKKAIRVAFSDKLLCNGELMEQFVPPIWVEYMFTEPSTLI